MIFASVARTRGPAPGLTFHSLRRSCATHLIEAGMDALFVQRQLGHGAKYARPGTALNGGPPASRLPRVTSLAA